MPDGDIKHFRRTNPRHLCMHPQPSAATYKPKRQWGTDTLLAGPCLNFVTQPTTITRQRRPRLRLCTSEIISHQAGNAM